MKRTASKITSIAAAITLLAICLTSCANEQPIIAEQPGNNPDTQIDIDFTQYNVAVAYTLLMNAIYENTQDYLGQTVKISGTYLPIGIDGIAFEHSINLLDESSCCSVSVLFTTDETINTKEGDDIEITGTLKLQGSIPYIELTPNGFTKQ